MSENHGSGGRRGKNTVMVPSSLQEMLVLLTEGLAHELIGVEESRWLDVKGQPYLFDKERTKWELGKDISAMANAEGGLILIAAMTEKLETYLEERISEVIPVPSAMVDTKQYLDTIGQRTFPSVAHRVRTHVFRRPDDKVLLALEVQPLEPDEQPIMVATSVVMDGKDTGPMPEPSWYAGIP
jgi:hypothetical protein